MMRVVRIVVQSLVSNTTENYYNFVVVQPLVNIKYIIHNVEHISDNFLSFHCFNSSHVWESIWGWMSPLGICGFLKKINLQPMMKLSYFSIFVNTLALWSGQRITIFSLLRRIFKGFIHRRRKWTFLFCFETQKCPSYL